MIKPSRNILIGGAVFVVAVAVLFAFTFSAALKKRDEPQARPTLQAASGTQLVNVAPFHFCDDIATQRCDAPTRPAKIAVEPGKAIVISLPEYITSKPWDILIQRYDTKLGRATIQTETHVQPKEATLVLKSTEELLLAAVEIRVPSPIQDQFGNLIAQSVWGIDTLASDYALVQRP
ncbi:DUF2771 family protein [Tsukamurella sp. 1534]|uniref:DUF2771 family protein n=1 Tax=Tsukamurella sp. 1534 TaxID=1151061 RepID=UPI0002E29B36|nr:DUF2771 family protein [Tsukamurella sp. 1534]